MNSSFSGSKVSSLQNRLGVEWPSIEKAHADTLIMRERLSELFSKRSASDTSVVVFGSVARFEVTSKSDTDWILLVDGSATPEHKRQETDVEQALSSKLADVLEASIRSFKGDAWAAGLASQGKQSATIISVDVGHPGAAASPRSYTQNRWRGRGEQPRLINMR